MQKTTVDEILDFVISNRIERQIKELQEQMKLYLKVQKNNLRLLLQMILLHL